MIGMGNDMKRSWPVLMYSLGDFDINVTMHRDKFFIIKPTRCTNSKLVWSCTKDARYQNS
jgi:hypothetical protein